MTGNGLQLKLAPNDPLLYDFPLPLRKTYFPMGFAVRVTTNSPAILQAADDAWGECPALFDNDPLDIRFAVNEQCTAQRPPAVLPRGYNHMVATVHSAENFSMTDLAAGSSFAWLSPSMIADPGYFRYHFLEPAAYLLLDALYLTPVHAACVALNGRGVLLCGDSGAGKTSLAYTCARKGWTYIADDASYLIRAGDGRRIIGRPHQIRFRLSAAELFPELAQYPPVLRANGQFDLELNTAQLGLRHVAMDARADYLVFVNRKGPDGLRPIDPDIVREWLESVACVGGEDLREQQRQSLRTLLQLPVVELCYQDAGQAERTLRSLISNEG